MFLSHFIFPYEQKQFSLTQIQNKCLEWNDHYKDDITLQTYQIFSHRITKKSADQIKIDSTTETTNVYIYCCLFTGCSSKSNGGVLYFNKATGKLLIEFSVFEECSSESQGGVVYVNCDCVINNICGYKCYAPNDHGQFLRANLQNGKTNSVLSSSICSTYKVYGKHSPLSLAYGSHKYDSVNISNYNVSTISALVISFASIKSETTHCCFVQNYAEDSVCLSFGSSSITQHVINSCNIVNNRQGNYYSKAILHFDHSAIFQQCNIIENEANYLFYLANNNPSVKVSGSYIIHTSKQLNAGQGSFTNSNQANEEHNIEYPTIDCMILRQHIITFDQYYYTFFILLFRASLFPSVYI